LAIVFFAIKFGIIHQLPLNGDAGIIHKDVEPAEFGNHRIDQWFGRGQIRLIAFDCNRTNTFGFEFFDDGMGLVGGRRVADGDVCAKIGKLFGRDSPKATRPARDEGDFAAKNFGHD
jgi:hypothetical protein